jgi:hypothetical protein
VNSFRQGKLAKSCVILSALKLEMLIQLCVVSGIEQVNACEKCSLVPRLFICNTFAKYICVV